MPDAGHHSCAVPSTKAWSRAMKLKAHTTRRGSRVLHLVTIVLSRLSTMIPMRHMQSPRARVASTSVPSSQGREEGCQGHLTHRPAPGGFDHRLGLVSATPLMLPSYTAPQQLICQDEIPRQRPQTGHAPDVENPLCSPAGPPLLTS
jgi:hypothetical protein